MVPHSHVPQGQGWHVFSQEEADSQCPQAPKVATPLFIHCPLLPRGPQRPCEEGAWLCPSVGMLTSDLGPHFGVPCPSGGEWFHAPWTLLSRSCSFGFQSLGSPQAEEPHKSGPATSPPAQCVRVSGAWFAGGGTDFCSSRRGAQSPCSGSSRQLSSVAGGREPPASRADLRRDCPACW